jgi:hypothetical protein
MKVISRSPLLLTLALSCSLAVTHDGHSREPSTRENPDSLAQAFRVAAANLSSPEMERRKMLRRALQQKGYTGVLRDVLDGDGLSGLLSAIRVKAQIEYSLPHHTLHVYLKPVPTARRDSTLPGFFTMGGGPIEFALHDDWTFPPDPWEKPK